jgi:hypothetical protein
LRDVVAVSSAVSGCGEGCFHFAHLLFILLERAQLGRNSRFSSLLQLPAANPRVFRRPAPRHINPVKFFERFLADIEGSYFILAVSLLAFGYWLFFGG